MKSNAKQQPPFDCFPADRWTGSGSLVDKESHCGDKLLAIGRRVLRGAHLIGINRLLVLIRVTEPGPYVSIIRLTPNMPSGRALYIRKHWSEIARTVHISRTTRKCIRNQQIKVFSSEAPSTGFPSNNLPFERPSRWAAIKFSPRLPVTSWLLPRDVRSCYPYLAVLLCPAVYSCLLLILFAQDSTVIYSIQCNLIWRARINVTKPAPFFSLPGVVRIISVRNRNKGMIAQRLF